MPELPEVETTRCGIERHLKGQQVVQVIIRESRLRWTVPTEISQALVAQVFTQIRRRAKYLLLDTQAGSLIIHLGMSGRLHIKNSQAPIQKHDHVDFVLQNQQILRYTDPRRFGAILWTTGDPLEHPLLKNLGPEPLSNQFDSSYLFSYSRSHKLAIKQLLMDSKMAVGVGNIYANEALFQARIHPQQASSDLSLDQCTQLVKAVKTILEKAIKAGGTTLKDFISADGKPGYFKQELQVYGRENQVCPRCEKPLRKILVGQRSTFYCTKCQQAPKT